MVWAPPSNTTVPVTQQDALPIFALGQAGVAGYFVTFAGSIFRYWSHTQLAFGLPAEGVPQVTPSVGVVSATLDLRGCRELALVMKRDPAGAVPLAYVLKIYIWPQFSDGLPSLFPADVKESCNSFASQISPVTPGPGVYVYNATMSRGYGPGGTRNFSAAFGIGFAKIVVIGFGSTAAYPVGGVGDPSFTWELWGQG